MRVVSNTSPLSNLAIIGRLEFLPRRYGKVQIPPAVAAELAALSHAEGSRRIAAAMVEGWLQVAATPVVLPMPFPLDPGETEAIALACEMKAEVLLMDEKGAAGGAAVWVGCGGCARGTGPREARGLDSVCAGGNPAAAAGGGILCGWGGGGFHFVAGWGVSDGCSVSPCSAIEGRAGMPLSPALSPLVPRGEREMEQSGGQGASGRSAQVGCAYGAAVAG